MAFLKRISGLRLRQYRSEQMLKEGINHYMSGDFSRASNMFEKLCEQIDGLPGQEFEVLRKELPMLLMADRGRLTSVAISGGLTGKQFESLKERGDVKSHLLYSAGFCQFSQKPSNCQKAIDLLKRSLNLRQKPKIYAFREVKSDISDLRVDVTDNVFKCESFHFSSFVSKDEIRGEVDEVASFRDAEFFGITYLVLAKALLYGHVDLEKASSCLDAALWYLEKTRHFDLNIILRGVCWFDKGTCNYYQKKFKEAMPFYDQALQVYERAKTFSNFELAVADCLLNRGECRLRLGDQEAATKDLERALDLSIKINQRDNVQRARTLLTNVEHFGGRSTASSRSGHAGLTRGQIIDLGRLLKENPNLASGGKYIAVIQCPKCGMLNPLKLDHCTRCKEPLPKR
jgi:tetratricopeptide (TPR) repeat protein